MSAADVEDKRELLHQPLHGIYIPVALVIFGTAVIDYRYIPYVLIPLVLLIGVRAYSAYNRRASISADSWRSLELVDKTIISRDTAIYRFQLIRADEILQIPVGHHLATKFEDSTEVRYYTPISSNTEEGFFDILVKSYADGDVSKKFGGLNPGQFVQFKGPVGRFNYVTNHVKKLGMIAGGSGITPILKVISEIVTTPEDQTEISIIYANKTENDILLFDELNQFAAKYPNFTINYTLETPEAGWTGDVGYITKEMVEKHLPAPSDDVRILICGPQGLKKLATEITEELGFTPAKMPSKGDDQVFVF
ncbi:hypothetical protein WICPIJ_001766 [Wickerhamomyces pijperi]|uniref:NADH-cytochrome b5 reductase n=1 Tax=Wickerhamomyces pijperi TaxID=599730 RepID=A0A9P8QCY3_WICPI|nr:hypothetical protein WICPIJ_001766 [Wickerhamomyces pijperi]